MRMMAAFDIHAKDDGRRGELGLGLGFLGLRPRVETLLDVGVAVAVAQIHSLFFFRGVRLFGESGQGH
jgi:hypothetical protein